MKIENLVRIAAEPILPHEVLTPNSNLEIPHSVEEFLHVRDCMLSSVITEKYYPNNIEPSLNQSKGFVLILASKNHVIIEYLLYNKSTNERVNDWLVKVYQKRLKQL